MVRHSYACVRTFAAAALMALSFVGRAGAQKTAVPAPIREALKKGRAAAANNDMVEARKQYRAAADLGSAEGQYRLASLLQAASEEKEALEWAEKAAAQGFSPAEYMLGRAH